MEIPQITQHIHLPSVDSTQSYLRENLGSGNILVSTEEQTSGYGRQAKKWVHQEDSLAFSFTLNPCEVPTLTPLEVSVLIAKYFKNHYSFELKLKWPNDLLNKKGEKCGGILIQNFEGVLIVGVGINLSIGRPIQERKMYPAGFLKIKNISSEDLSKDIYEYILGHRLNPELIRELWLKSCIHLGMEVQIDKVSGIFKGIGPLGEAQILGDEIKSIFSGELIPQF